MDAKALAADIRKAIRTATKTDGDPLYGLRISVRKETASLMTAVNISVEDLPDTVLIAELAGEEPAGGYGWATRRAQEISNRLHELAAPALAEADGRHSFCSIYFGGLVAPSPREIEQPTDSEDARYEELNAAELQELADDAVSVDGGEIDDELCPGCLEVMGACACEGYDHSLAKEDARNAATGIDPATPTAPTCPNGHGPMRGRADITTNGENFGTWHTCTDGCHASYIAPSAALLRTLAERAVIVGPRPATEPAADTAHRYGARRGALAAVR
ncbi:hypothetical protein [Pseudonocardia sp. NPDC049635]|uniref:hypothetical protein n=1 Tax=Pseudonocardia sp. NPDC049635 TaxID=3155506 RepID=UPI0033FE5D67